MAASARGFGSTLGGGSTDRIELPAFVTPSSWSMSFWLNRNGGGGGGFGRIIEKNASEEVNVLQNGTTSILIGVAYSTTRGEWEITDAAANVGSQWIHLLLTGDGTATSGAFKAYVNGKPATVSTTTTPVGTPTSTSGTMLIGNRADLIRNYDGMIGDFAMASGLVATQSAHHTFTYYQRTWRKQRSRHNRFFSVARINVEAKLQTSLECTACATTP